METFVVRVWTSADPAETGTDPTLRGVVEHVGAGAARRTFRNDDELVEAIQTVVRLIVAERHVEAR